MFFIDILNGILQPRISQEELRFIEWSRGMVQQQILDQQAAAQYKLTEADFLAMAQSCLSGLNIRPLGVDQS